MTLASLRVGPRSRLGFGLVLVLALGAVAPSQALAADPAKELRVPAPPSQDAADTLAAARSALPDELLPAFAAVVADAQLRLRASERQVAEGEGEKISIEDACRAALIAADFAGASKRKAKSLDGIVALAALQLTFDVHAALREQVGRSLAIRAVRACNGVTACLDGITPTTEMPARHVIAVRRTLAGKTKDLQDADRLGNFEIQYLMSTYVSRVKTSDKMHKLVMDFVRG